jgi:hypothetical protein
MEWPRTDYFKYLGVLLSEYLKWDRHIASVVQKSNRTLGLLTRFLYNTPKILKLTAYKTMCRSQIEYAAEVWDPFKKKDIEQLEMLQRRAVHFICNLKGVCSITEARESILLESLEHRRKESGRTLLCRILASDSTTEALQSSFPDLQDIFSSKNDKHNTYILLVLSPHQSHQQLLIKRTSFYRALSLAPSGTYTKIWRRNFNVDFFVIVNF